MSKHSYCIAALLAAFTAGAAAQSTPPASPPPPPPVSGPVQSVTVSTTRDPVDKSYRRMIKGMDRFEREHALAPQASLRFRLLPRLSTAKMSGISLRIAGDREEA